MYRMTILYGTPTNPDVFDRYYREVHIPLAREMKGLTGWSLSWMDKDAADPGAYHLIAELYAESRSAMEAIMDSPEGQAARRDLDNFVTGSIEFLVGEEESVPLS